tara:strand:+ start:1074 stop:1487 length:414 start_codon:yes stop_codon:yes gene_type:complete
MSRLFDHKLTVFESICLHRFDANCTTEQFVKLVEDSEREFEATKTKLIDAKKANEVDRTKITDVFNNTKQAMKSYEWLRLGRGSYEYDDDRWKDEFGRAFDDIMEAIEPLRLIAGDLTNCPETQKEAIEARQVIDDE